MRERRSVEQGPDEGRSSTIPGLRALAGCQRANAAAPGVGASSPRSVQDRLARPGIPLDDRHEVLQPRVTRPGPAIARKWLPGPIQTCRRDLEIQVREALGGHEAAVRDGAGGKLGFPRPDLVRLEACSKTWTSKNPSRSSRSAAVEVAEASSSTDADEVVLPASPAPSESTLSQRREAPRIDGRFRLHLREARRAGSDVWMTTPWRWRCRRRSTRAIHVRCALVDVGDGWC